MNKRKVFLALALILGISSGIAIDANALNTDGWIREKSYWTYYKSGEMCKGWINDGGKWYYLDNEGKMLTGMIDYHGEKYYLNSDGSMATGWVKENGDWYYFNKDGSMKRGFLLEGSKQYYLGNDGVMLTGLFEVRGINNDISFGYRYADSDGSFKDGWININGKWYYFLKNKELASNISVDGYYVNEQGIWDTANDNKVVINSNYSHISNNVYLTIVNCTSSAQKFNGDFILERKKGDEWISVASKNDKDNSGVEIPSGEKKEIKISLEEFDKKTNSGKYRIGIKLNNDYVYNEFWISRSTDHDSIKIKIDDDIDLTSIKEIPFTLVNESDEKVEYESPFILEVYKNNCYEELKLKDNIEKKNYILNPGESAKCSIPLSDIEEKLEEGRYKITAIVDGAEIRQTFYLTTSKMLELTTDREYYRCSEDAKVIIKMVNKTNKDLSYEDGYKIEGYTKDGWKEITKKGDSSKKHTLKAKEEIEETIDISDLDENYLEYRIVKNVNGYECRAEFEYSDAMYWD